MYVNKNRFTRMKTDLEYLKGLMNVFLESSQPFIAISDLKNAGFDITTHQGLHHYSILIEKEYVSAFDLSRGNPEKLGYSYSLSSIDSVDHALVRLTAEGIEFAQMLQEPSIYEKLKGFSQSPLNVMKDVGSDLLKAFLKKKLD